MFQQAEGAPILNLIGRTTDEGASNEGYYRWKANSSLDWTWKGFDLIGTVHYINGFKELTPDDANHYVSQRFLFDLQASYEFSYGQDKSVSSYSKDSKAPATVSTTSNLTGWQRALNGLRLTVGCNNVFDKDPPKAFGEGGNAVGYPGFTYDSTGRFISVRVTKKF